MTLENPKNQASKPSRMNRRRFIASLFSATSLAACGASPKAPQTSPVENLPKPETPNDVDEVINTPAPSKIDQHIQANPEVGPDLRKGEQRLRNAEAADSDPARASEIFETMLRQTQPTMILPNSDQVMDYMKTSQPAAFNHFKNLSAGEHGIYIDGANKYLYVLEGSSEGTKAIRRVSVTTAANGFGNTDKSKRTPLGSWPVKDIRSGRLGEVMAYRDADGCPVGSLINTFQQGQPGQSHHACIVTEYIAINHARGIGIHGTNYEFDHNGNLRMQQDASGGCIRCTNADIAALVACGYVGANTPVFITGTPAATPAQQTAPVATVDAAPEDVPANTDSFGDAPPLPSN